MVYSVAIKHAMLSMHQQSDTMDHCLNEMLSALKHTEVTEVTEVPQELRRPKSACN